MEEQQDNTTEPDSSMEELKIAEDENVKEISFEDDILGAQSLLMSESDEDVGNDCNVKSSKSPQKKISPKRRNRLLDSDDDDLENKYKHIVTYNDENLRSNKKKITALIDSDSDDDQDNSVDTKPTDETENGVENAMLKILKHGTKNSKSNDNLESKEQQIQANVEEKLVTNKMKISPLIDSDSDIEQNNSDEIEPTEKVDSPKSNDKLKKKAKKQEGSVKQINKIKTNSENRTDLKDIKNDVSITKKGCSIIDTDSSGAESERENVSDLETSAKNANFEKNNEISSEKNIKKIVRASAKKAMDEMQAIQSEQQRLHREAHISIPYHKPRKHTLDEFLKRRTIMQPQNESPVAAVQTRNLKMTTEELEEYAKLMEERAKEATEFFKSESENEEEDVFKDNEGALDKPVTTALDVQNENEQLEKYDSRKSTAEKLMKNQDGLQLTEEELKEILADEEMPQVEEQQEQATCSKVLITEVIELPKLDMNTVRISPVKRHTPRSSLNVKQLLAEKILSESPSLSGDPNKLIDLETGNLIEKKPSGMDNLVKRLMSTVKAKKVKNSEFCNILSVESGKLEMSKVNVTRSEVKDPQKEVKPGAAYFELKKSLKDIITKKRLEEIHKKLDDELEYSKCLADDDSEDDEVLEEYEPDEKPESNAVLVDEEENDLIVKNDREISGDGECAENKTQDEEDKVDDEDTDEEEEDVEEDEEDGDEENDCDKPLDKSQRKSRIITAFDESDEEGENDDIDFLKPQPITTQPTLLETQSSVKNSLEGGENELMALCSGTFDDFQKNSTNALMSQIPITQNCGKPLNDHELMELCSGSFDQPAFTQQENETMNVPENLRINCNKILSSEEENHEEPNNKDDRNKQKIKKLTKKQKKKKAKLGFSDDEDEEEDEKSQNEEDVKGEEESNDATEEPETFIDYDSEENEILVQMTKNDKVKQAQNFFEKEAELSESDWGSADEDENNIDKYDIELGDEDEFDREKLQTELGKIHARKMLDEDIREVRKIQELLFEDEEKDGVGRQRTFKWKNAESGFSLEDGRPLEEGGDNQNGDSGDEINEHQWRKIRYEREQFLKEQGLKPSSQDTSTILTNTLIPLNSTVSVAVTTKKLQIITAKKTTILSPGTKKGSPFLISKGVTTTNKKSVRGSFLVRDKETLKKLAGLSKGTSSSKTVSDMDDTAGTVSIKSVRPNNFVFATLTEEEHENLKRKADDLLNSSNENGKNYMKKPKIEPRRDKCFIDQLL